MTVVSCTRFALERMLHVTELFTQVVCALSRAATSSATQLTPGSYHAGAGQSLQGPVLGQSLQGPALGQSLQGPAQGEGLGASGSSVSKKETVPFAI